jgi:hypothetical protein
MLRGLYFDDNSMANKKNARALVSFRLVGQDYPRGAARIADGTPTFPGVSNLFIALAGLTIQLSTIEYQGMT